MYYKYKISVVAILTISLAGLTLCDITQEPQDETVELGKDITLQCVSDNAGDLIEWRSGQYDDGNSAIFSTTNGIADPSKYELEDDTGTNYNLIVKNTVWNDGGEYRCNLFGGASLPAQLVVLDQPTSTLFTLVEGQTTEAMCQVFYSGSYEANLEPQHLPQIRAFIDGSQQTPNNYVRIEEGPGEDSLLKLIVNYTADSADHGKIWTCEAYTDDPYLALKTDTEMNVQFPVRDMVIVPSKDEFMAGEVINCTAQGHPDPDFAWNALQSGGARPVTGNQLHILEDMMGYNLWECRAINTAPGSVEPIKQEKEFTVVLLGTHAFTAGPEPTTFGSCDDITGQWKDPISGARLVLTQTPDSLITGTYSDGLDSGWFTLNGQRAHTQNTFGFTVIGQSGLSATSFTGECRGCGPDTLYTKVVTYNQDENGCTKEGSGGSPEITAIEQNFLRE